ncbi:Protein OS-9 [Umbelopsis sp. WA50703]
MLLVKSIACLALLSSTAVASNFFVHEDVLAHPVYSIQLGKTPIANSSAQRILEEELTQSNNDLSSHQELQKNNYDKENYSYMLMKSQLGQTYLCQIPKTNNSSKGDSASEKEEPVITDADRKERGLQLLAPLYKNCIYAWPRSFWAYEYCHLEHVKQFNSPPNSKGYVYPPGGDPENQNFVHGIQYVLGRFNGDDQIPTSELQKSDNKEVLLRTSVHTIGQRSYLAQRWRYGDKCDITGKPREIEIQFHCSMQHEEHIESVQELATCEYQMVISTPRLCQDVAFAPRASQDVNRIQCDPVISDELLEEFEQAEAERHRRAQGGTQVIFNKLIENGKGKEEQEKLTKGLYDDTDDNDDVGEAVADVTEELLAALEQELDQLIDKDDKSRGEDSDEADDRDATTNNVKDVKKPQVHFIENIEGLEGFTIEDFLSSKNLEQQLQDIVKAALSQAKVDIAEDPKSQPVKPKDQGYQHPRIQENLNAYKQIFANDQDENDEAHEQPVKNE